MRASPFTRIATATWTLVALLGSSAPSTAETVRLYFDSTTPQIAFAAADIKAALEKQKYAVQIHDLAALSKAGSGKKIVLAVATDKTVTAKLSAQGGEPAAGLGPQAYALRTTTKHDLCYWVVGGDASGAMYGGLHLAELIAGGGLQNLKDEDQNPFIFKRGIKFNIPLDQRTPSHDDRGTAAQANVGNMWDMDFWKDYLDELARTRYNVLSLWSRHPFPSLIRVPDYPTVALDDVHNASGKVKSIGIDDKISFWKQVMDYAHARGIEFHFIVWNIHMDGVEGEYGITEDINNSTTKDYLRKSVRQLLLTYPRLSGIGVTAGENMKDIADDEKEQWLWDTYGKGVQDVKQVQPGRPILFIHRHWLTSFDKINSRFSQLSDGFDMEFKYAQAHMYASYDPPFARKQFLPELPANMKTWWNVRNDDIYNLRWGDPEFAKQFVLHFPRDGRTAGYFMGSDRYVWGRESISKNPQSPRQLENLKHWYSFLLWGRLGYDPHTPTSLFQGLIQHRFPGVSGADLFTAWKSSSQIVPLVNRFHWFAWDYQWWVEACTSTGHGNAIAGFHTVRHFIAARVMDGSGLMTIPSYVDNVLNGKKHSDMTPVQVADQLEKHSALALARTSEMSGGGNVELEETIGDIRAMAYLGAYYAKKIRGATDLALFEASKRNEYKVSAVAHLRQALEQWQQYAAILDRQYNKMNISMHGVFDWNAATGDVRNDIATAQNAN
jgi:hypothetical protein